MSKTSATASTAAAAVPAAPPSADAILDITRETCPMTFVRTRLALDRLAEGQTLRVTLLGEEPIRSVPAQVRSLGHEILEQTTQADGRVSLLLRVRRPG